MTGKPRRAIKRVRQRIKAAPTAAATDEQIPEADKETLLELDKRIKRQFERKQRFGAHHYHDTIADCFRMSRGTGRLTDTLSDDPDVQDEAIEEILDWVGSLDPSPYVDADYRSALRVFGDMMVDRNEEPKKFDRFKQIKIRNRQDEHNPTPMPSEIVTWPECVEAAATKLGFNQRDTAMVCLQYEGGFRPMSEVWPLKVKQIDDRGDHLLITIENDNKVELARDVSIRAAAPLVRRWLENHPWRKDPTKTFNGETPLWVKTRGDHEHISYTMFKEAFYDCRERAGLEKPFNPQHLRACRASTLAAKTVISQVDLENFFGWVRGSSSAAHYIARFGSKTSNRVAIADGAKEIEIEDDDEPIVPVVCEQCDRQTVRHLDACLWCSAAVDIDGLTRQSKDFQDKVVIDEGQTLMDLISSGQISLSDLKAVRQLEDVIKSTPNFFAKLDDYIDFLKRIQN